MVPYTREQLQQMLKRYFGFDTFRPLQADIVEHILGRHRG